jgi:hypothetical protein
MKSVDDDGAEQSLCTAVQYEATQRTNSVGTSAYVHCILCLGLAVTVAVTTSSVLRLYTSAQKSAALQRRSVCYSNRHMSAGIQPVENLRRITCAPPLAIELFSNFRICRLD